MRILIIGGAGMLGRKLAERLSRDGLLGQTEIRHVSLVDIVEPAPPAGGPLEIEARTVDLADAGAAADLISDRPDVVFHLAAVLSGEAEADFEKGYRVNLDGTRHLFEAIRAMGDDYCPRVVFASSIAIFGAPFPDVIGDEFCTSPLTSYGTQKAMCELLLADYTRRGYLDGIGLRLPTISVRPGTPNLAASGFFSSIIREPLNGEPAVLPVSDQIRHWHASPRSAVGFLLHAATLDSRALGDRRSVTMPGVSVTVAEQLEALRSVAGDGVVALIRREPDDTIARIVGGWPHAFDARRARELGFHAESSFEEIIRVHVEDELGGRIPAVSA